MQVRVLPGVLTTACSVEATHWFRVPDHGGSIPLTPITDGLPGAASERDARSTLDCGVGDELS